MGCCIVQAWIDADGLGLSQSWRAAAVTALTGFQSAMACSQPGMCWVGTSAAIAAELPLYTTNPDDFAGLGHLVTVVPVTRPEVPNERQAAR